MIVKVYRDHGISGAKGRDKRPAFNKLCRDAARREFDMVMAWSWTGWAAACRIVRAAGSKTPNSEAVLFDYRVLGTTAHSPTAARPTGDRGGRQFAGLHLLLYLMNGYNPRGKSLVTTVHQLFEPK